MKRIVLSVMAVVRTRTGAAVCRTLHDTAPKTLNAAADRLAAEGRGARHGHGFRKLCIPIVTGTESRRLLQAPPVTAR